MDWSFDCEVGCEDLDGLVFVDISSVFCTIQTCGRFWVLLISMVNILVPLVVFDVSLHPSPPMSYKDSSKRTRTDPLGKIRDVMALRRVWQLP